MNQILLVDNDDERRNSTRDCLNEHLEVEVDDRRELNEEDCSSFAWTLAALHYSNPEYKVTDPEKWGLKGRIPIIWFSGGISKCIRKEGHVLVPYDGLVVAIREHLDLQTPGPATGPQIRGTNRHSQANVWGAYALWRSAEALQACASKKPIRFTALPVDHWAFLVELQFPENVGRLKAELQALSEGDSWAKSAGEEFEQIRKGLIGLCIKTAADRGGQAMFQALLVDDELSRGWQQAYKTLLEPALNIVPCSRAKEVETVELPAIDIALVDKRLDPVRDPDPLSIDRFTDREVSGMALLRMLKNKEPHLPVIMCTASNKSWSFRSVMDAGGDGYWGKEGVQDHSGTGYSVRNALALLREVHDRLEWGIAVRPIVRRTEAIASALGRVVESTDRKQVECEKIVAGLQKRCVTIARLLARCEMTWQAVGMSDRWVGQSQFEISFLYIWSLLEEWVNIVLLEERLQSTTMTKLLGPTGGDIGSYKTNGLPGARRYQLEGPFLHRIIEAKRATDWSKSQVPGNLMNNVEKYHTARVKEDIMKKLVVARVLAERPSDFGGLWSQYDRCREFRNKLDLTHGTSVKSLGNEAVQNKICDILQVLARLVEWSEPPESARL